MNLVTTNRVEWTHAVDRIAVGDRARNGVRKDVDLFFPMLVDGAIVAFDDFSRRFPDLIEVLEGLLEQKRHCRVMTYANTLVIKYKA